MYFWNSPEVQHLPSLPSHLMVLAIPAGQEWRFESVAHNIIEIFLSKFKMFYLQSDGSWGSWESSGSFVTFSSKRPLLASRSKLSISTLHQKTWAILLNTLSWKCLKKLADFVLKEFKLVLTAGPGWPTGPIGPGGPGGPYQHTSTETMSKTTKQQIDREKQHRETILIHTNWYKSASLTCSPFPPLAPFWPCSPTSPCNDEQTSCYSKDEYETNPDINDQECWWKSKGKAQLNNHVMTLLDD